VIVAGAIGAGAIGAGVTGAGVMDPNIARPGPIPPIALAPTRPAASTRLPPAELRGVWITSEDADVLRSRTSIAEALEFLARHNVNAVFPSVWYRGVTLHPSRVLEGSFGIAQDPAHKGRDPLAEILSEAHVRGIEVIPWFEQGFAASSSGQPTNLLVRKPEWAARGRDGEILERNGFTWMNALDPEVQAFVRALVLEVARNYDIDGVHGDERLPALPITGGYDTITTEMWRKDKRLAPPPSGDERWTAWRAGKLTDFLARLSRDVHDVDQHILISVSPAPYRWGLDEYLQDSKTWLERGLVDMFHPQCFRREFVNYRRIADEQYALMPKTSRMVYAPAILIQSGAWRIDASELLSMIEHNRNRRYGGEILSNLSGLLANDGALAGALSSGPYAEPARVPHRSTVWRPKAREVAPRVPNDAADWAREKDYVRARNAGRAEVVYFLDAPTTAWFQVWLEVPDVDGSPRSARREFTASDVAAARIPLAPGLADLGAVYLEEGQAPLEMRLTTAADEAGRLAVGRVWLAIDRKRSPDAVWR
jgi:uncharacterized lipoprotein YddW (UPF0748 family)